MSNRFAHTIYRVIIGLSIITVTACIPAQTPSAPTPSVAPLIIPANTATVIPTLIPQLPPVKVDSLGFIVDGKPFRFIGVNSIYFGFYDEYEFSIDEAIRTAKENGISVLRIYLGFGEGTWSGKPIEKIDKALDIAAKNGVYVIATLTDCCCLGGEWGKTEDAYFQKVPYCDVTSTSGLTSFKEYIKSILLRKNSVNGKIYRDDTTILGWDVANEQPLQLFADSDFNAWLLDVTSYIKTLDPEHLITIGIDASRDIYNSPGTHYEALNVPGLDFYSFHFNLPNYHAVASNLDSLRYRTEMLLSMGKPVVLEEFGVGSERVLIKGMDSTIEDAWLQAYRDQMDTAYSSGASGVMFWGWGVPETKTVPLWWNLEDHDITETNFVNLIREYQIPPVIFTPYPAATISMPQPTDVPIKPVYIHAMCTYSGKEKTTHVPASSMVNILWGFGAKTEAQINDYLENNKTIVTFNGKVIEGAQYGGIKKNEARNIYEVIWVSPIGILDPGQYTITYDVSFTKKIEDGGHSYGPGGDYETLHDECLLVVE